MNVRVTVNVRRRRSRLEDRDAQGRRGRAAPAQRVDALRVRERDHGERNQLERLEAPAGQQRGIRLVRSAVEQQHER